MNRRVGSMMVLKAAVRQLRPKQWSKNVFLFAALVFSGQFLVADAVLRCLAGFVAFSLLASAGYILNDYLDREADRRHPTKRFRPIASGALPPALALAELAAVLALGVAVCLWLGLPFLVVGLAYLATTLSYSFVFKHMVILDVMFLAAGFVWRVIAGALAIGVAVSPWLFICTAFLALFLGFNKRRGELMKIGNAAGTRRNLIEYNERMLTEFQSITSTSALLCYALYCVLGPTPWMTLTMPPVIYGIFRYVYLVEAHGEGGAPDETLFRDTPLLATVAVYGLTALAVIFGQGNGWLPTFGYAL